MSYRVRMKLLESAAFVTLVAAAALPAAPAPAADAPPDTFCHNGFAKDGTCLKTAPDEIKALHIVAEYCDLIPQRDMRGVPLDPALTDKQAAQYRVDGYNNTERKLAALRQRLAKLDHAAVDEALHAQMQDQDPDDPMNLICGLEIAARLFPQEYGDYAHAIKPGVDTTGFVDDIRKTFLGKMAALHESAGGKTN